MVAWSFFKSRVWYLIAFLVFLNDQSSVLRGAFIVLSQGSLVILEFFNSHPALRDEMREIIWLQLGRLSSAADDLKTLTFGFIK